jgi:flagellar basal body-associated protein FliL
MKTVKMKALLKQLKSHREVIAKERDALRALLDEFDAVALATDEGIESLDNAIQAFSEQV